MGLFRQIIFLLFLLVVLFVFCVYSHTKTLHSTDNKNNVYVKPIKKINIVKHIAVKLRKKDYFLNPDNMILQKLINEELKIQKIIFKRLSTQVTEESDFIIAKIAKILNDNENIKIEVAGHTDARGSYSLNESISLKRAKAVKAELIKHGIFHERVSAKGYGESMPIVRNDPEGYSMINRRVEFNIIEELKND